MWLLKATGDPNRQFRIGSSLITAEEWIRPASSFTFPACEECNHSYGKGLETQARKIILAIQNGKPITVENAYRLLDWLDKVRIGLWLGFGMLHKEGDFTPRFSIDTRLGRKDRLAIVSVDPTDTTKRLTFGGTDNNLFRLSQCAMFLGINNIRILSISADFLLTRETGLPHGVDPYLVSGKRGFIGSDLVSGTYDLSQNWGALAKLGGTILAQPIIDGRFADPSWALNYYANSRVLERVKDSFKANGVDGFLRIIPLQLITNTDGTFRYHPNKRERLQISATRMDDGAFMRTLYALMADRSLRNFPRQIKLPDGRIVDWLPGWQICLDCTFQILARLADLGIEFTDVDSLVEEIQRIDRALEEIRAHSGGTLVNEEPLIS